VLVAPKNSKNHIGDKINMAKEERIDLLNIPTTFNDSMSIKTF